MALAGEYGFSIKLQEQLSPLMDGARVGSPAMVGIDNELVPILKDLMRVWSGNDQHPSIRQLFSWLSNPQRSADEFIYVVGPLWKQVWYQNGNLQPLSTRHHDDFCPCLVKVAFEALAAQCRVLEGDWEYVAWALLHIFDKDVYSAYSNMFVPDYISTWIINVIGNPDLCPNPYLQIGLMILIGSMINIEDQDNTLLFESVMSACTGLDMEYVTGSPTKYYDILGYYTMNLKDICDTLDMIIMSPGNHVHFGQKLSEKVLHVKTSRLSTIFHDVSYSFGLNPSKYSEPTELQGLTTLLKVTVRYSQLHLKTNRVVVGSLLLSSVILIVNFKITCQMAQLIDVTASLFMEILNHIVLLITMHMHGDLKYTNLKQVLREYEEYLKYICLENCIENITIASSPWGQLIRHKYHTRLSDIRKQLKHFSFDLFPRVYNMIYAD